MKGSVVRCLVVINHLCCELPEGCVVSCSTVKGLPRRLGRKDLEVSVVKPFSSRLGGQGSIVKARS